MYTVYKLISWVIGAGLEAGSQELVDNWWELGRYKLGQWELELPRSWAKELG